MPEPPPPELLPLAAEDWEGAAEEEGDESETTTMLVTTCPPGSVVTTAEVNVVEGVDGGALAALVGVALVCAGVCEVGCCAAEDWVVDVSAGCCCCDVDEAAGGLLEDAACCVDDSAGVADEAGAAGEGLAETEAWRGKKTFLAGGFGSSTRSLRNTRANIRKPARMILIPKNCAARPPRMFERQ